MIFNDELKESLWNGEHAIFAVVHNSQYYWLIDYKYNICLDAEKDYLAYLNKGLITEKEFNSACEEYRNGILKLDMNNFYEYLKTDSVISFSIKDFLNDVYINEKLCLKLVNGIKLSDTDKNECYKISSLLPVFYIDFDNNVFHHMDFERSYENTIHQGWSIEVSDFSDMIPKEKKYWIYKNYDLWMFKMV